MISISVKNIIWAISILLYRTIGPRNAIRLALSPFGKLVFNILAKIRDDKIPFRTKYRFLMKMGNYEYFMSGFCFLGETNPLETHTLKSLIKNGEVVVDVGAHIGWYTLVASQCVGRLGKVISFEPHPFCIDRLRNNVSLNNFTNVKIEQIALSDKNKKVSFWIGDDMGGSLVKENTQRLTKGKVKRISVKAQTLDSYVVSQKIKRISLIKIDVEGAELKVLRGAKNILQKQSPYLIVEVIEENLKAFAANRVMLFNFVREFGYKPYLFTKGGVKQIAFSEIPKTTINLLFSKKVILETK